MPQRRRNGARNFVDRFRSFATDASFCQISWRQCGEVTIFKNGSWIADSLMGMLIDNEIDITGNICSMSPERMIFLNMSYPVYYAKQLFVLKKPLPEYHFDVWAPLQANVWLTFIILILAQGSALVFILLAKRVGFNNLPLQRIWDDMEFICETTIGWLFALYSSYVMISFMFPKAKPTPFESGTELVTLMENGEYIYTNFKDPPAGLPDTASQKMTDRFANAIEYHGFVRQKAIENIYGLIINDRRKLVTVRSDVWVMQDFDSLPEHDQLETIEDKDVGNGLKGYYWTSNFSFKNEINYFLSLSSAGLVPMVRRRYLRRAVLVDLTKPDGKKPIRIDQFAELFTMYAGCLAGSIVVAIAERFYPILRNRTKKTQKEHIYRF